jgi:hypothetical protein
MRAVRPIKRTKVQRVFFARFSARTIWHKILIIKYLRQKNAPPPNPARRKPRRHNSHNYYYVK